MSEPDDLDALPAYDKDRALRSYYGSTYVACGVVLAFSVAGAVSVSWWYWLAAPLCVFGVFANYRSRNAMTRLGFLGWKVMVAIGLFGGIGVLAAVTSQLRR
jgi:hypothetical protein